ncbi:hypothetical protein Tco_0671150 [Tanacetum coccineum]
MSNTNNNLQIQTSNALHNAIMEAGGKDHPPMLAPVAEGSLETTTEGYIENYKKISQDIRDQVNAEAEAIQIILTGIDNDIYSTVDACPNACEMWKAIERLRQDHNKLLPKTEEKQLSTLLHPLIIKNLKWLLKMMHCQRRKRLINSFKKIYKPTNNNLRTSSNTSRANHDNTPRINKGTGYDNQRVVNVAGARENAKDAAYHKEKMILCKQEEAEIQLSVEQADWRDDTDDEPDDQELEAHYMYMAQMRLLQKMLTFLDPSLMLSHCKSFVKPEFLKKAQRVNPRLYDIDCYNDNLALMLAPDSDETIHLAQESRSKLSDLIRPFDYEKLNNLCDLFVPQRVIPTTSVSRPQLKSNQFEDKVMPNNSQWKMKEVEDHHRNFKFSNNKTSITACVPLYPILHCLLILLKLVEIILFIVDSGCSKHMTGNLKLLSNFVEKFLGTVKFGNDQIAPILGYGDLVNITIKRVYYVKGLNHNLFFVGQLCDADLEVAFWKSTCYVCDLKENDLFTGSRGTDLYSITLQDLSTPNPICLMAKATSSQAWLWH